MFSDQMIAMLTYMYLVLVDCGMFRTSLEPTLSMDL